MRSPIPFVCLDAQCKRPDLARITHLQECSRALLQPSDEDAHGEWKLSSFKSAIVEGTGTSSWARSHCVAATG
jgi:hypothetical protein